MKTIIRTKSECCKNPNHVQSNDEFKTIFCNNCYNVISYNRRENEISSGSKPVKIKIDNTSVSFGFTEKHLTHEVLERKHKYHFIPKIDSAFAMTKKGNIYGLITTEEDKEIGKIVLKKSSKIEMSLINRIYLDKSEKERGEILINKFCDNVKAGTCIICVLEDSDLTELKLVQPCFLYLGKYKDLKENKEEISKHDKKHLFVKLIGIDEKKLNHSPIEFIFTEKNQNVNQIELF